MDTKINGYLAVPLIKANENIGLYNPILKYSMARRKCMKTTFRNSKV
jgi:hypothetical protein